MNRLEKYIEDNAVLFDSAELPDGHFERFLNKMDSSRAASRKRKVSFKVIWTSAAVAASLISAMVIINRQAENDGSDWLASVGNDQAEICRTYYERAGELYDAILKSHPDGSLDLPAANVAEETIPLLDQLPEEMDPQERAAVLKEYYGTLLEGLERIRKIK